MTRPRPSCSSRPARGQGAVELLVALPSLLLLVLSVLQFSLVFTAKSTLDQAMFRGVRAATLDHGSLSALRTGAAQALAALYPNGQSGAGGYALALAKAQAALALPSQFQVVVLNPTAAAMAAWDGPYLDQGQQVREIPQAHLIDTTLGSKGGETLQSANLLSVQGRWCQPLIVPFVNTVIAHLMAPLASGWDAACYAQGGIPLIAQSTQLMQSTLWPQIHADVSGRRINVVQTKESEAIGNCILAGFGVGIHKDMSLAAERMVRIERVVEPRREYADRYAELFSLYKDLYRHLKEDFSRLAKIESRE